MPQRRFNRPKWRYVYRQRHPSEAGGGSTTPWQQLIVHQSVRGSILESFLHHFQMCGNQSEQALHLRDKIYDRLAPNQTNRTNTLPSLFTQGLWRCVCVFFLPSSLCIIHYATWRQLFSVADMRGCCLFHVEHGAALAGSLGTHCEYQVLWRVQQALLIHMHPWSHIHTRTMICTHETVLTYTHAHTYTAALQKMSGTMYILYSLPHTVSLCLGIFVCVYGKLDISLFSLLGSGWYKE